MSRAGHPAGGAAGPGPTAVWDADDYSAAHAHHRAGDAGILAPLALGPGRCVVDLGCGTGELTDRIARTVGPAGLVVGVEPDPSLYAAAAARTRPGLGFVRARGQDFASALDRNADTVVSVAMLHWVPEDEQPLVLAQVASVLGSGGQLRLDCGGEGQIAAAREVLAPVAARHGLPTQPWSFPGVTGFERVLADAGFALEGGWCRLLRQRRSFTDEGAVLGWLRSQVLNAYTAGAAAGVAADFTADAEAACRHALRRPDGTYDQDYVRLDVLARRI